MKLASIVGPLAVFLTLLPKSAEAPVRRILSYQEMARKADLAVIATPIERRELDEPANLPGWFKGNEPVAVVAIETTFRVVIVIRPTIGPREFTLLHYRWRGPEMRAYVSEPPRLVDFVPEDKSQYLMFLKKRDDQRYESFDVQQPDVCIEKLGLAYREVWPGWE